MQNIYLYKNKSTLTVIILLSISFATIFLNLQFENFKISRIFFFITYPFQAAIKGVSNFFGNTFTGFTRIKQLEKELSETRQRLLNYQEKTLLYSEIIKENTRLKQTLDIKKNINYETTYAQIIFRDPSLQGDYFVINKGKLDNIRDNMPVVSFDTNGQIFLVGKTTEVSMLASKVRILTAGNFLLGVALKDSGYVGILNGNGSWNQNCILQFIPVEANAYIGQEVVTSGESDIFPYGILVGKVVAREKNVVEEFFQKLYIRPEFDYSRIKELFILQWSPGTEVNDLVEDSYEQ